MDIEPLQSVNGIIPSKSYGAMFNFLIWLASLAVVSTVAGFDLPEPELSGGTISSWGMFPSAAFLSTPALSYCGAAVIHPEFVLTLAQCVYDERRQAAIQANLVEVIAGDIKIIPASPERQQRNVLEVIVHQNYTAYNHNNDIALLRVDKHFEVPSNSVEMGIRRRRIVSNGAVCLLPGWGVQRSTSVDLVQTVQKYLSVEILDRDSCNEVDVHGGRVRENMICAGNLFQSSNAACSGNLGSPLFCDDQLTGLLSFGINCGLANDPPVFTQVRFFNHWIDDQIGRNE